MKNLTRSVVSAGLLALLTGCNLLPEPQLDPVRFFTLSKPVVAAPVADSTTVRLVQLAPHLRGRKMAVRVAEHEVVYLDDISWAEPLDDAILSVLRTRLSSVGGGAVVVVQVQRCELVRNEGETVQLSATYTITPANGTPAQIRRGVFVAPIQTWDGKNHAGLVQLISVAIDAFGDALATAVTENK